MPPLDQQLAPPLSTGCSFASGPGLDHRGCPPQASPTRHLAGQGVAASKRRLALGFAVPAELGEEAVMQIAASVMVCVGLIVTLWAPEQLAALPLHPFPCLKPRTSRLWLRIGYSADWSPRG